MLVSLTRGLHGWLCELPLKLYPSSVCNRNEVYVCSTFFVIIAWLRKTYCFSDNDYSVCDLHLLFSIPFSLMIYGETMSTLGFAAVSLRICLCVLIASVLFLNEKAKLMQILGLTIAITALTGILLEETNTSTESLAGYRCAYFCCVNPCHNLIHNVRRKKLYCLCYHI